jgi:hypothetical protein
VNAISPIFAKTKVYNFKISQLVQKTKSKRCLIYPKMQNKIPDSMMQLL